jgi:hypothetical protein
MHVPILCTWPRTANSRNSVLIFANPSLSLHAHRQGEKGRPFLNSETAVTNCRFILLEGGWGGGGGGIKDVYGGKL